MGHASDKDDIFKMFPLLAAEPLGVVWNGLRVLFNYSEYLTPRLCEKIVILINEEAIKCSPLEPRWIRDLITLPQSLSFPTGKQITETVLREAH